MTAEEEGRSLRWWPGVADLVFGLVLASVLVGGRFRLLNDPGTLWHLRLGRDILASGTVPRVDTLTFTHAGETWVDQSWLFDVVLATVVDYGGWSAAGAICAMGIALIYASVSRAMLVDGHSPLIAMVVPLMAAGIGAVHFLVRPHLLTLGFVWATLRLCQRQHDEGGRFVFYTPLLMIVWANVHGGFLAGPLIVFTAAVAHAGSGHWDAERRREVGLFLKAAGLCCVAALVNPYGFGLYEHVARLLVSSGVTSLIEEYQPMPFGKPDARVYEIVLIALLALPALTSGRMRRYELIHALVWLHLSLASIRHAPLFALAVAPGLAQVLDGLPHGLHAESDGRKLAEWSIFPGLTALVLAFAVGTGMILTGFDPQLWPVAGLPALDRTAPDARLFHEQDWGGLIAAEANPTRKTFLDDRFELYGKESILHYLNALEGGPDWDEIRDQNAIGLVWLRRERGLTRRLSRDPAWSIRYQDEVSVLFQRKAALDPDAERLVNAHRDTP